MKTQKLSEKMIYPFKLPNGSISFVRDAYLGEDVRATFQRVLERINKLGKKIVHDNDIRKAYSREPAFFENSMFFKKIKQIIKEESGFE